MLPYHDGKCRGLHGHSYKFFLEVRGGLVPSGPKKSMVVDFKDMGVVGKEIVLKLDHTYLNDVLGFEDTTAERISLWIFNFAKDLLPNLWAVSVKETESSLARYAPIESRVMDIGKDILEGVKENLMSRLRIRGLDECWIFTGPKDFDGYGYCSFRAAGTSKAHRLMMWLGGYEISGKVVMHTCDNPSCCNLRHLRLGTHKENERDKDLKGRRPKGGTHGKALLTDIQVSMMWDDFLKKRKGNKSFIREWEEELEVKGRGLVSNIIYGWSWNHITGLPRRTK